MRNGSTPELIAPDLSRLRGAEARLLVRDSLDFLRSLGYDVVEQFVVPASSRPIAKNDQGPPLFWEKGPAARTRGAFAERRRFAGDARDGCQNSVR